MPGFLRNPVLAAVHTTMSDLARAKAITPETMRKFDSLCLVSRKTKGREEHER